MIGAGRRLAAMAIAASMACGACSSPHQRQPAVAGASGSPRLYLAIGASETRGAGTDNPLRQAWAQDFFRNLPANYSFINLALPSATAADALTNELPFAQSLHASVITVWLNVNDVLGLVPVGRFSSELSDLVHGLRAGGATVLVANTPPLDRLPGYVACESATPRPIGCSPSVASPAPSASQLDTAVDTYNAAIARVVAQQGAILVDLHSAGMAARAQGAEASLISGDGLHPNAAGAQRVADQFTNALRSTPGATAPA